MMIMAFLSFYKFKVLCSFPVSFYPSSGTKVLDGLTDFGNMN